MNRLTFANLDKTSTLLLLVLSAVSFIIPICNALTPVDSALHFSAFTVSLLGKYLTFALLGLSLDLVWGYCGILALGHGAFFALGGYAMGMYLMRQIGTQVFMVIRYYRTSWFFLIGKNCLGFGMALTTLVLQY